MITRRRFLQTAAAGAVLGASLGIYTWQIEPHWLEVVERPLAIAHLPEESVGWRLVQLSDLHIGPQVDDTYLVRCFDRINDLSPELVVYTGDFISYEPQIIQHARRMFAQLPRGRHGTYGILGNHDYGPGWSQPQLAQQITAMATDVGVRVLRNEMAASAGLHIVGLDDLWARRFDPVAAFAALPSDVASLALSHNPDTVDQAGWDPYSGWILAGHTHGGQCKPPFLTPPLLPVRNRRYTAGPFALSDGRNLYINRGLGHLLQVRFNVRPEMTVHRLCRPETGALSTEYSALRRFLEGDDHANNPLACPRFLATWRGGSRTDDRTTGSGAGCGPPRGWVGVSELEMAGIGSG